MEFRNGEGAVFGGGFVKLILLPLTRVISRYAASQISSDDLHVPLAQDQSVRGVAGGFPYVFLQSCNAIIMLLRFVARN